MVEAKMARAVARYLRKKGYITATEVPLYGMRMDIVAYSRSKRLFQVIECKPTEGDTGIGRAFGQLATYHSSVTDNGFEFLRSASKKLPSMSFRRWMQATHWARYFEVSYYVALTHGATLKLDLVMGLKKTMPQFGIIRVKPGGGCRSYIYKSGRMYSDLTTARPQRIKIVKP